jgi:hypothetical protein
MSGFLLCLGSSLPLFPVGGRLWLHPAVMAVVAADCTGGDSHLKGAFGVGFADVASLHP